MKRSVTYMVKRLQLDYWELKKGHDFCRANGCFCPMFSKVCFMVKAIRKPVAGISPMSYVISFLSHPECFVSRLPSGSAKKIVFPVRMSSPIVVLNITPPCLLLLPV